MTPPPGSAAEVMARVAVLGEISEEPGRLTRRFATPALTRAGEIVAGWMGEAGLRVRRDSVGNVIGRLGDGVPLVLGSHIDTVPDAGRFDGPLGVLAAIAVAERLAGSGAGALEVVAFADEEGARYGTAYLGSAAYAGRFEPEWLGLTDPDGITVAEAIRASGGDPDAVLVRSAPQLAGYVEVHIEQGPVLEREGLPVGVVTAIAGQTRVSLRLVGEAGHAGTLPMEGRRDALAAAADVVLAVERVGRGERGLVATVGALSVTPGASNVVPGEARLSLDVRHASDAVRRRALGVLRESAERVSAGRRVGCEWEVRQDTDAIEMSGELRAQLGAAIDAEGYPLRELVSGAGHDAVALAPVCPVAMLFVRCAGGISHDPRESVAEEDVAVALDVLERVARSRRGSGAGAVVAEGGDAAAGRT